MRILIIGAGALGGLIGARLFLAGHEVHLLEVNVARAKLINEQGLLFSQGQEGETRVPLHVITHADELQCGPVDLLFVAVKSYQTEAAIRSALPAMGPHTWVLSTQNGIGNVEVIASFVPPERILSGITFHSIQHTGPNRIRYRTGIAPIQMAPVAGPLTPEIEAIGEMFRNAGLATDVVPNVDHAVWKKLLHNAVVNPVSALTGLTCSELLEDSDMQELMRGMSDEIIEVMRARGVPIQDEEDPYRPVIASQKALAKNRPSMWQDLVRGFPTEIDAINGGAVDEAKRLGLQAPLNWAIVRMMHSRERIVVRQKERAVRILDEVRQNIRVVPAKPTVRGQLGGMPSGRVPLECAPKLKEIFRDYYRDLADAAQDPRRRVAWCSGLAPTELLRAMGFAVYLPENHAALIGASRLASKYISRAVAEGFSPFVSTEMTSEIGAMLCGETPLAAVHGLTSVPAPDVLVYDTNLGQALGRWFEYYGARYGVPAWGLHSPQLVDEVEHVDVDAAVLQMHRLIDRIERQTGERLNHDRLAETLALSAKASRLWRKILTLAEQVPSPITYFDMLIHVAPMAAMRGMPQAVTYYETLLAELEERVANGVAAVPDERFRFYWEGPPIWCALRPLARLFLDQGVAIVGSTYTSIFALDGFDADNPIESMARTYLSTFTNRSRAYKLRFLDSEFTRYAADAIVYHDGRTAPELSNVRHGLRRESPQPSLIIEADSHDLRLVSMDQIQSQLVNFIETARRNGRAGVTSERGA